jgi:hypothetical protein
MGTDSGRMNTDTAKIKKHIAVSVPIAVPIRAHPRELLLSAVAFCCCCCCFAVAVSLLLSAVAVQT